MEIRVLRYFLEVAREESITHAAVRLHVSQPTLSKQLKDLETELGQKLFVRTNYSIRLTDAGMLLRKRAEDLLRMSDRITEEFRTLSADEGGNIHIGCAESDGMRCLARCIRDVQARHPRVRCHLYSGNTEDLAGRLDSGILDFAVIVQDVDLTKYNYLELPYADTWGVIMRKDSPLAGQEAVHAEGCVCAPEIREALALITAPSEETQAAEGQPSPPENASLENSAHP